MSKPRDAKSTLALVFWIVFPILFPGILLIPFIGWMCVDSLTHPGFGAGRKTAWFLVNLLVPVIGSIIYYYVARPSRFDALRFRQGH